MLRSKVSRRKGHSLQVNDIGLLFEVEDVVLARPVRCRPVATRPDRLGELVEERPHRLYASSLDIGDAHAVDSRGASVGRHVASGSPHHVAAGDLAEERMKRIDQQ